MAEWPFAIWMLEQEVRALKTRLDRVKPFVLQETMVPAAAVSFRAQAAIENYLSSGKRRLHDLVNKYLNWLRISKGRAAGPAVAQRRYSFLRLRFNALLTQFDLFADVFTQRSESETGVWLAGLDVVARDALTLPGGYYYPEPEVICYLDRGIGAAIRRARTRLPGGGENPVAIIRVPRERMIGSGIASSLVHEVGHQGAALLGLLSMLREELKRRQRGDELCPWRFWERWISEIVADFWSVARVGVTSTLGLMGVVSLPRAFVFRVNFDDPHPAPWIRVKLSCAMGNALFPHPQWGKLARLWEAYYPVTGLHPGLRGLLATLERAIPEFLELLVTHRPRILRGASLADAMGVSSRQPMRLADYWREWREKRIRMFQAPPCLVFAVLGQARLDGHLSPEQENRAIADLLTNLALQRAMDAPQGVARALASKINRNQLSITFA